MSDFRRARSIFLIAGRQDRRLSGVNLRPAGIASSKIRTGGTDLFYLVEINFISRSVLPISFKMKQQQSSILSLFRRNLPANCGATVYVRQNLHPHRFLRGFRVLAIPFSAVRGEIDNCSATSPADIITLNSIIHIARLKYRAAQE